eukprot:jgi/Ulvmu1/6752/UM030_0087.1
MIHCESLQRFVSSGGCASGAKEHFDIKALKQELCNLNDEVHSRWNQRDMHALTSVVKNVLAPMAASHENSFVQPSPEMRGTPLCIKAVPIVENIVVQLIRLAQELGLQCVHEVLCGIFAEELDSAPTYVLQQALSSGGPGNAAPSVVAQPSVMCILAQVHDLARAVKACPAWQPLLRTREAKPVFAPRIFPVADVFEEALQPHNSSWAPGATWHDAHDLFQTVLSGTAPHDHLVRLLHTSLKSLTLIAPQHLGHFTFFSALLLAIERSAQGMPAVAVTTAGAAAAECVFDAVVHMRGELLQRLESLTHSPPQTIAVEHFTLLAQARELLSRTQELAALNFDESIAKQMSAGLSSMQDELSLNFAASDRTVHLASALPVSAVAGNPLLARVLSGSVYRVLPQQERERLGLPRPTAFTAQRLDESDGSQATYRCVNGVSAAVPLRLIRAFPRLQRQIGLLCRWRALCCGGVGAGGFLPPELLRGAPLHVHAHALHEMLDFARAASMNVKMGNPEQVRAQFKSIWLTQVSQGTLRDAVRQCADVLGCEEASAALRRCG